MATVAKLFNTYITDEVTEERFPNEWQGISHFAPVRVVLTGHVSGAASVPELVNVTVRLQHADAIEGPYEDVPGCSLEFFGRGSHDYHEAELDADALKGFLNVQTFADGAADGGATILLVQ